MPQSPRLSFALQGGLNTVDAPDEMKPGSYPFLQNVRKILGGRLTARPPLGSALETLGNAPTSAIRMNDPYMSAPGFVFIAGGAGDLYVGTAQVASGFSGLPLSFLPYGPPDSPQPWCYIADASLVVTIPGYSSYTGPVTGMVKVRSDGTIYKTGIMEPQAAPVVSVGVGGGTQWVTYRYTYRSSITGATSNPSPESAPQTLPQTSVTATILASSYLTNLIFNASQYAPSGGQLRTSGSVAPGVITDYVVAHGFNLGVPDGTQVATVTYSGGTGMTAGTYALNFSGGSPTVPATGTVTVTASTVTNITITNQGEGYSSPPAVTAATGGTPPTFTATLTTVVTINGVQAAMNWLGQYAGTGVISGVALFYQGQIIGQIKAPGILNQQSATSVSQGGAADTWGATLTPAIVNDTTFGIGFQITTAESGGSDRSFLNSWTPTVYYTTQNASLTATASTDPQVDKIDIYRQDAGLDAFTYVGTIQNSAAAAGFIDTLTDLVVAANPQLSFANYEPFPSIDLPRSGTMTVAANGVCTQTSGDIFNVRWLPGTIILIANPAGAQIAYELYNRPTSTTSLLVWSTQVDATTGYLTFSFPPAGTNLVWEIIAPTLAAEPSPVIWGPTPDNAGSYYFGLDPLNPGDLLWSMGNNFDSAPDTNRLYVTSAAEALQNGTVTSELSTVFSTERFWLIYSNFSDAVATVTGTQGQQWTLVQAAATRGLYMRYALGALGSSIAWRAKDSICLSQGGGPEKIISEAIRNLFPQGGQKPSPVTVAGQTVYPPNDANVAAQTITMVPGYIFYNFQDALNIPRTLCYDVEGKGWTVDAYTPPVNFHAWAVGVTNHIIVGCTDSTLRSLDSSGTEGSSAIVVTASQDGGSARTLKRIGGVFLRAAATVATTVTFWANRLQVAVTGATPATVGPAAGENDYLFDFTGATGADVQDLGLVISFPLGGAGWLKEWQNDWTEIPEPIVAWRTGMLSYGLKGWLHIPWLRLAYISTSAINLSLTTDQGASVTLTVPSSSGSPAKVFLWLPAITAAGAPMKFRLIEWTADAGGTPFTVLSGDIEVAIHQWGDTGPYDTLRPFKAVSGIPQATT